MGQRDSRSAVFLCQPHRELWRPSSQSRGTSEPQRPRKAEEGASHMAYSYLLVVEYGGPGSEEGKDVPKVTHKFDGAQLLWLPADRSLTTVKKADVVELREGGASGGRGEWRVGPVGRPHGPWSGWGSRRKGQCRLT